MSSVDHWILTYEFNGRCTNSLPLSHSNEYGPLLCHFENTDYYTGGLIDYDHILYYTVEKEQQSVVQLKEAAMGT